MRRLLILIGLMLGLAGCSSPTPGNTTTTSTSAPTNAAATWQNLTLTDVRNNQTFKLADFKGKTLYVEPMATWCTNCRAQLANVKAAKEKLNDDTKYVFIGLSVETTLAPQDLVAYVKNTGYDWHFAVLTPEALTELSNVFGRTIANPPTTPHFIVYPDGRVSPLRNGIETPEEIIKQLTEGRS